VPARRDSRCPAPPSAPHACGGSTNRVGGRGTSEGACCCDPDGCPGVLFVVLFLGDRVGRLRETPCTIWRRSDEEWISNAAVGAVETVVWFPRSLWTRLGVHSSGSFHRARRKYHRTRLPRRECLETPAQRVPAADCAPVR
jgi:hypothetical protein